MNTDLLYTNKDHHANWFYNRYYYGGGNTRYYTFQIALNLLYQTVENPVIIETGCQRQEEDVGAGMSTSIFAEYIERYGGKLVTVDIDTVHLSRAKTYCKKWPRANVEFFAMDSIQFLQQYNCQYDLIYLDSLDYPVGKDEDNKQMQYAAQLHCLNELKAAEKHLHQGSIVLLDDNNFSGGGKPRLAKEYLIQNEWICLLDLQSTLWIKRA